MKHVMVDLETLGNTPGCVILSLGAVEFDPDKLEKGRTLHLIVNQQTCLKKGLKTNQDTIDWWSKQSDEAKTTLRKSESEKLGEDNVSIDSALIAFKLFLQPCGDAHIWGNGSDFDNAIMACAYEACGIPLPWKFWNNRCYRTIKSIAPHVKMSRTGTFHNALDDAISQVDHLFDIIKKTGIKVK